jgi:hypothetical protein
VEIRTLARMVRTTSIAGDDLPRAKTGNRGHPTGLDTCDINPRPVATGLRSAGFAGCAVVPSRLRISEQKWAVPQPSPTPHSDHGNPP